MLQDLGTPSDKIWAGYSELPMVKKVTFTEYPYNNLRSRFGHNFTDLGFDLLNRYYIYRYITFVQCRIIKCENIHFPLKRKKTEMSNIF